MALKLLTAAEAAAVDAALMASPGYSIDQLMELAGLAVAEATFRVYPPTTHPRALVLSGPGNNGGDGLVAARWLKAFGYAPSVVYPRRGGDARLFTNLLETLAWAAVPVSAELPPGPPAAVADVIVDAVFGFSFKAGGVRPPYGAMLAYMRDASDRAATDEGAAADTAGAAAPGVRVARSVPRPGGVPVVAVDVPSGWHVDEGDVCGKDAGGGLRPSMLVSLTAPKRCAAAFDGPHHWLGGRFAPPA